MTQFELGLSSLIDIGDIFGSGPIFIDTNGDGYPDDLDLKIIVSSDLTDPYAWAGVLNLTARLAFEVTGLNLPVVQKQISPLASEQRLIVLRPGQKPLKEKAPLSWAEIRRIGSKHICLAGYSGKGMMALLNGLAISIGERNSALPSGWSTLKIHTPQSQRMRISDAKNRLLASYELKQVLNKCPRKIKASFKKRSFHRLALLNLVGDCGLYESSKQNPRARKLRASLIFSHGKLSSELGLSLAEIISRMALEATDITLPLVHVGEIPARGVIMQIREGAKKKNEIRLLNRKKGTQRVILAQGTSHFLAQALKTWVKWGMIESGPGCEPMDALREQIGEFQDLLAGHGYWGRWAWFLTQRTNMASNEMPPATTKIRQKIEKACHILSLPKPPLAPRPRTLRRHARWEGELEAVLSLFKQVRPGQGDLFGEVLVSKPLARRKMVKSSIEEICRHRGYQPHLMVFNAYKPGLSWLLEHILPRLKTLDSISRMEISYRPFPRRGKCLEMRSRWLQEIFPGPELLARALGIDLKKIQLLERRALKTVYRACAWDCRGRLVLDNGFSPRWSRLPYLSRELDSAFVHPSTGGIKLWQSDKVILDQNVATDRERFWQIFQNRWLPLLENHMEERLDKESAEGQVAFWEEIYLEFHIEETDISLGLGEERICPMEALHEDIYFVFLDAFSAFARRKSLPPSFQLGRIVPRVFSSTVKDKPTAKLRAKSLIWSQTPPLVKTSSHSRPEVVALNVKKNFWHVEFGGKLEGLSTSMREKLVKMARVWGFEAELIKNRFWLRVKGPSLRIDKGIKKKPPSDKKGPPNNRLLTAREVTAWIKHLNCLSHLDVWQAAHSWQGRPVWVMEATLKGGGVLTSTAKLRLLKPTLLFNARHHANEISSTNAVMSVAWHLAATEKGRKLLKHVNVAWIPMENPDGVATFEELLPEARDHKLHAARYNALGAEYYSEYFARNPRFPEAQAKRRLWQRWLPQVMVDHHGVPCHEWDQPFSGYAPFRFREFWIPRTFVFAYIPFVGDTSHPEHKTAVHFARILSRAMSKEDEIVALNRELVARYQRYARGPEPKVFPPSAGEALLVLPPVRRIKKTNFAVLFPQVTKTEIVVEVPDEGSSGRHLELCIKAHEKIQEALILFSHKPKGLVRKQIDFERGCVRLSWFSPHM